jgi:hypothetical protein
LIGVAFQNRHYIDKALERLELKNSSNLRLLLSRYGSTIAAERGRVRTAISFRWPWVDCPHGVYDDHPPSPGARPLLENRVPLYRVFEAGDKTLFRLFTIRC